MSISNVWQRTERATFRGTFAFRVPDDQRWALSALRVIRSEGVASVTLSYPSAVRAGDEVSAITIPADGAPLPLLWEPPWPRDQYPPPGHSFDLPQIGEGDCFSLRAHAADGVVFEDVIVLAEVDLWVSERV